MNYLALILAIYILSVIISYAGLWTVKNLETFEMYYPAKHILLWIWLPVVNTGVAISTILLFTSKLFGFEEWYIRQSNKFKG